MPAKLDPSKSPWIPAVRCQIRLGHSQTLTIASINIIPYSNVLLCPIPDASAAVEFDGGDDADSCKESKMALFSSDSSVMRDLLSATEGVASVAGVLFKRF